MPLKDGEFKPDRQENITQAEAEPTIAVGTVKDFKCPNKPGKMGKTA